MLRKAVRLWQGDEVAEGDQPNNYHEEHNNFDGPELSLGVVILQEVEKPREMVDQARDYCDDKSDGNNFGDRIRLQVGGKDGLANHSNQSRNGREAIDPPHKDVGKDGRLKRLGTRRLIKAEAQEGSMTEAS